MPSYGRHHFNQIINQLINQKTLHYEGAVVVVVMQEFKYCLFCANRKIKIIVCKSLYLY
jgi:hypothetical protein